MDLKLDENGELTLENNDLVLTEGIEKVIQELSIRLKFFINDWFLDNTAGLPYFETIFKKGTDIKVVNGLIQKEINKTADINEILTYSSDFNGDNRVFRVDFSVSTTFGTATINEEISV